MATDDDNWLALDEAAAYMKRGLNRIKSQIRNGRIRRGVHFRLAGKGELELNVTEYQKWLEEEKRRRRLPLLERVRLSMEDHDTDLLEVATMIAKPNPTPTEPSGKKRPKLIPVTVWAEETFGEYAPSRNTLYNWIKTGLIYPMPTKVGRQYFCSPDAEYFDPMVQKVRRMTGGS